MLHRNILKPLSFHPVPVPPSIESLPENLNVLEVKSLNTDVGSTIRSLDKNNITLRCNANGLPKPSISWSRDGNIVQTGSPILRLIAAKKGDTGSYTCIAENLAGKIDKISEITVEGESVLRLLTLI